mgnify:CR=1 FL=1
MASRRALERQLATLEGFVSPRLDLEQYPTPPDLAAHLLHLADLRGDVTDRPVVDLGAGTGVFAIGATLRGASRTVGVESDPSALEVARRNERTVAPSGRIDWVLGDATRVSLCPPAPVTVLMNPPFGAQRGNVHADRAFLETAARIATVSYSVHNADSHGFVDAFAADHGGTVTDAFGSEIALDKTFPHHEEARKAIDVEVFRIEWNGVEPDGGTTRPYPS